MKKVPYTEPVYLGVKAGITGVFTFHVKHDDGGLQFSEQFNEGEKLAYPANQMRPGVTHTVTIVDPKNSFVMFGEKSEFNFTTEPAPAEPETKK
jgi:hypothetical protein